MSSGVGQQSSVGHERTTGLAQAAIALRRPVIPCGADKRPLTKRGFYDASRVPEAIRRMFAHPAAVMIGVPTGDLGGFVVIDIDVKAGRTGMAWLERHRDALPATRLHHTMSGGLHYLFQCPNGTAVPSSASQIHDGVDVRGEGGYVIVPPSPGYAVSEAWPLAEMPAWLVEACKKKAVPPPAQPRAAWDSSSLALERGAKRLAALLRVMAEARQGERHNRMFWVACRIAEAEARGELPGDVALAALRDAAAGLGLGAKEIDDAIRDGRARACCARAAA
jgi:hypothetical protein